ncbi:MAG: phosphatidylcholine/phosphatidylserine synthase [Phycisphaeraceae bacterium]|nr:phosphatidylcholine/phosphatidylserine synthase [Phycisphaeraceae bacterium]
MVSRLANQPPSAPRKRRRRRLRVRKLPISVFPTMLTLGNVLCGFMAIFLASLPTTADFPFNWTPLTFAAMALFAGMVFDGFDGRVARLTNSTSAFGAQLDSMADMVTFGVAPAFIAIKLIDPAIPYFSNSDDHLFGRFALIVALIYVACAALRLARYTVAANEKHTVDPNVFTGLPSPGAAGTVAALILLQQHLVYGEGYNYNWLIQTTRYAMIGVVLLTALAMVSKLPYTHFMNRYLRGKANIQTLALYVIVALLLLIYPQWTLAIGFVSYAVSSPISRTWRRFSNTNRTKVSP